MSHEEAREEQNQVFQPEKQQMSHMEQRSGYEIPVELVPLPSKGLVYGVSHPLHRVESVEIKSMSAKEEDILSSQALLKNGTVLSELLRSCMLNKTIDVNTMITGDRNAVLTALRITGYGPDYDVRIRCPDCREEFENTFDLSQIPVKPLGVDPVEIGQNLFDYKLPSGRVVHFKLFTGEDEITLSRIAKGQKKIGSKIERGVTSRLGQAVVAIDGQRDLQKIAYAVQNMPARDSRALRTYMDKIEPGLEMKQEITCDHCGEQSEVSVPLGLTFFWPDASI